jgi:UDPglucose 6-dehydrogenase
LNLIASLLNEGATICVFDPEAMKNVKQLLGDTILYSANQYDALLGADALIIATEWNEFRTPDFSKITSSLKEKVIFDGRNLFDLNSMIDLNYHYESVGRAVIN